MAQRQGRNAYRREVIAEFEAIFPHSVFRGIPVHGNAGWTPRKILCVSVIMFWISGKTLEEQFSAARHLVQFLWPHWKVPVSYAGFVQSQQDWWPLMAPLIFAQLRQNESMGTAWRGWCWRWMAVDGSRFECPRSQANEQGLGCAGREKTSPQLFQTLLQHVETGLPWDVRLGPGTDSERRHLDDMLADLPERSLLTADAGFISDELCAQLIDDGHPFVLRIGGNKTLLENREEQTDSDADLVYFWPEKFHTQQPLKLRRICFPSTGGLPVVLLTNVLDANVLSAQDAQEIDRSRWGIEVYFRHLKQTMSFTQLRSRTPQTALNEQVWKLVSFWMLQRLAVGHQLSAGQDPRRFSAALARREIREVIQLLAQHQRGLSLATRLQRIQKDFDTRTGPKAIRKWPRKKNDKPPRPPQIKPAPEAEIIKAKQLGFKSLRI